MKRLFLTVVAVLSMTMTTFAEGEEMNNVDNVSAYDMTVNSKSLARALDLTDDQLVAVEEINAVFSADMLSVAAANKEARKAMMNNAVAKTLREMHYVLDNGQYRRYLMLLNTTINNRGLNK